MSLPEYVCIAAASHLAHGDVAGMAEVSRVACHVSRATCNTSCVTPRHADLAGYRRLVIRCWRICGSLSGVNGFAHSYPIGD
ncbi:unnamed protein product, partial [Iphiclides podalirius]